MNERAVILVSFLVVLGGCESVAAPDAGAGVDSGGDVDAATIDGGAIDDDAGAIERGVVHVVLFTHIEDQTPGGMLGTEMSRNAYLRLRAPLIEMAERAREHELQWVLQPDWKFLEAALLYEDAATTATTGGQNLFVYLRDSLGVVIDPHSHESMGYNYTDVAYLLEQLGVGGSTVIGGHVWDPELPQFQEWDRFRVPVAGQRYPSASWRGDILIGAGTPMHVNDPLVSGVWRPAARDRFFEDDPSGNIYAVGSWEGEVDGVEALVALHESGTVPADVMLTSSWNIQPSRLTAAGGIDEVEASVLVPIDALRDEGSVVVTDFTSLIETWRTRYAARAFLHQP